MTASSVRLSKKPPTVRRAGAMPDGECTGLAIGDAATSYSIVAMSATDRAVSGDAGRASRWAPACVVGWCAAAPLGRQHPHGSPVPQAATRCKEQRAYLGTWCCTTIRRTHSAPQRAGRVQAASRASDSIRARRTCNGGAICLPQAESVRCERRGDTASYARPNPHLRFTLANQGSAVWPPAHV
jgi:hypothetical protein